MTFVLDTNIAIHLRDDEPSIRQKVAGLSGPLMISIITRVELEGGVFADPARTSARRARIDILLRSIPTIALDDAGAEEYARIIAAAGYSRRKVLDRMIAAQALVLQATLVTMNPDDFKDIPGLKMLAW